MQTLAIGQPVYFDWEPLNVRIDRFHDGVSIKVATPLYNSLLSRTFTNDRLNAGWAWLQELNAASLENLPVWRIEERMAVLIAAGQAITTETGN